MKSFGGIMGPLCRDLLMSSQDTSVQVTMQQMFGERIRRLPALEAERMRAIRGRFTVALERSISHCVCLMAGNRLRTQSVAGGR